MVSKNQKVFWGPQYNLNIRHLWQPKGFFGESSACGLMRDFPYQTRKGEKCKNCLRAIKY